jgi:hypothetical protein
MVEWRAVPGSQWTEVSDDGRQRSYYRSEHFPTEVEGHVNKDGRRCYGVRINGKRMSRPAAWFVLLAFVGPCPVGMECCHNDGDCSNDKLDNLRWGTRASNSADTVAHGRCRFSATGDAAVNTKIPDAVVQMIQAKTDWKRGEQSVLARQLGVGRALISNIKHGWRRR